MKKDKKSVLVLGAGLVGRPMALDLVKENEFKVGIADISKEALATFTSSNVTTHLADLSNKNILLDLCKNYDYLINAVPGFMGYETLRTLIEAEKPIIDIAFYPEDPFTLHKLAVEKSVCVICDMGVAPGMSHLLSGYAAHQLEKVEKILIYVGGLPKKRTYPWEYKAVFSPSDVIEEYTRPARLVENGQIVFKEALSEQELLEFEPIGTLEAFNSDGLRSLVYTLKADYMAEKTLRYQGHIDKIKVLKSSGFFSETPVNIDGQSVSPLEFTKKLLFNQWKLQPGEEDQTVMRIIVEGLDNKTTRKKFTFDMYDEYDPQTEIHSMARTTGYAATAAMRLIHSG
ncbi:MAG: saccharopine dehydrogenase C-terminal domain-containing protein, partial [Ignavibacteria bacterium]|nr:saccharopine dehydrogenase C-terminal domain-containing protein [Ignavibacteria bacterium]